MGRCPTTTPSSHLKLEKADLSALPVGERNLLLLVCREVLCAAAEPYVYEAVTATFECGGHTFTAKGRHVLSLGWKDIDRIFRASLKEKPEDEAEPAALPDFTKGQTFDQMEAAVTEHFTAPSKTYTEDTLLSAMENAGKEDIPEDAERRGLGTPATRAAILEKLVAAGFVERKGKSLIPTKARINLVTVLPDTLTSPILTAEWEQKLTAIARGEADPAEFMAGITGWRGNWCRNIPTSPRRARSCSPRSARPWASAPAAASRSMRARRIFTALTAPASLSCGRMTVSGPPAKRS